MTRKVNCCVVGTGSFGLTWSRALQRAGNARLVCVVDLQEQAAMKAGQEFGVPAGTDYRTMLEDPGVEAVLLATPNAVHAEQTVAALEAGKHVLCTKPMATSLTDADAMIVASRRTGRKLEIGFNRRYDAPIVKVKDLIASRSIGRVFYARASALAMRPHEGFLIHGRPPAAVYWEWYGRTREAGGGCLMTHNSHELDYLQWFFGEVDWVMGRKDTVFHPIEVEDVASAVIQFKDGLLVSFDASTSTISTMAPTLECFGEEGVISLGRSRSQDLSERTPAAFPGSAAETTYPDELLMCDKSGTWQVVMRGGTDWFEQQVLQIRGFCHCILEDTEPFIPGEEGRKSLEIVHAIYRSSDSGQRVTIPLME